MNSAQYYFIEVQPILRQLPSQLYQWINDIITEQDLDIIHPVVPNEVHRALNFSSELRTNNHLGQLPNFVKGLGGFLKENSPEHITDHDYIGFMDAGGSFSVF